MIEPTTAAGRHFLLLLSQGLPRREGDAGEMILAIETEACADLAAENARLRDRLLAERDFHNCAVNPNHPNLDHYGEVKP